MASTHGISDFSRQGKDEISFVSAITPFLLWIGWAFLTTLPSVRLLKTGGSYNIFCYCKYSGMLTPCIHPTWLLPLLGHTFLDCCCVLGNTFGIMWAQLAWTSVILWSSNGFGVSNIWLPLPFFYTWTQLLGLPLHKRQYFVIESVWDFYISECTLGSG